MEQIGIFFGTDSGTTRLIAKKIAKLLGETAAKPVNVNRCTADDLLKYDALILGTPSYGIDELPGLNTRIAEPSWHEFMPQLAGRSLAGKRIALFGLGDQEKYPDRFAHSLIHLYRWAVDGGAEVVGQWPLAGYQFEHSPAVVDGRFVGLVIDQRSQSRLTDQRLQDWVAQVGPVLREKLHTEIA
ncbi:flavodoxin [Thauera sp. CAU 1555]|uniref:Flavodoxin n=1 Tax=Thauera sedimentorum TaxID=2767595 RepID=A0ABR9BCL7_9RHOO|nr:flavodoxin [Thauera sedimentorum]MBC9073173.1 flavodoxin [Thauera sedimentorum]MBD8504092.1 flavodoxin [Thauera sedimentorum]